MGRDAWQAIRDQLSNKITSGMLTPGAQLPTESELCRMFEAGRHSVRRAVAALAVEGKLRVEQGRGTFVEAAPKLNYHVGRRTRFRQNLLSQGFEPVDETLAEHIVPASASVSEALQVDEGAPVHQLLWRSLADGVPIGLGFTFQCATRFPDWAKLRHEGLSVTEAYHTYGISDYVRNSTSVHSRRARAEEAKLLQQHIDQPVLVVRKVDTDMDGVPIGHSEGIWAASRVQFVFDGADDIPIRSLHRSGRVK
ncbi:phosphonate metabolism transcriptional regulator PhnF [Bradyrhizobium sp. WSM 1738]|uniref:phosphonate metabolism transcriptional regulator PhnF n=1 Tax=Bradyrhizobium hereditatis TaxID=2821405 RepID=UPI001CE3315D|nr:phosphonate metabolism transcriptional regulator PhnF [Bradyrhizobium hereditatis]MCA6115248.1 phosphonate metabolism transcriptional regulator PhnF [Bradyrhizobium hereditatis]